MASEIIKQENYVSWIAELKKRYKNSQIKAAVAVNRELLSFYWHLGKDIHENQFENTYGSGFYAKLSADLKTAIPEAKGFSVRNIAYAHKFYLTYSTILQ